MSLRFMACISVSRKQKKPHISVKLCSVIPLVQNSNSFLEDLRRLNQLTEQTNQSPMPSEKMLSNNPKRKR